MNCTYYDNLRYFDIVGITVRTRLERGHTCPIRAPIKQTTKLSKFNNLLIALPR
jgi:hypothetical protein